jgi:leucine-rich repeat-containing protein 49
MPDARGTAMCITYSTLLLVRTHTATRKRSQGEQRLRLLNYQNNAIERITNLDNLPNLIFLDLYNNRITSMGNLAYVPSLRVLMLGKNKLEVIENLEPLSKLDVLDLHSNRITKMENLGHMAELRVLNLAGSTLQHFTTVRHYICDC